MTADPENIIDATAYFAERQALSHPWIDSLISDAFPKASVPLQHYLHDLFWNEVQTFRDLLQYTETEFFVRFPTSEENQQALKFLVDNTTFSFKIPRRQLSRPDKHAHLKP